MKIDWKNIFSWQNIAVLIMLFCSLFGFLNFETSWAVKIIIAALTMTVIIYFFWKKNSELVILVLYFLSLFDVYNLYFMLGLPLWFSMLLAFCLSGAVLYFLFVIKKKNIEKNLALFYAAFYALVALEVFLSLIPWPADPRNKAMIILGIFYLFYNTVFLKGDNEWEFKRVLPYISIALIIIILVVTTIRWYGY